METLLGKRCMGPMTFDISKVEFPINNLTFEFSGKTYNQINVAPHPEWDNTIVVYFDDENTEIYGY